MGTNSPPGGRQHAYSLIDAHTVERSLSTMVDIDRLPMSERVARELAPLLPNPDVMADVWRETLRRSGGKPFSRPRSSTYSEIGRSMILLGRQGICSECTAPIRFVRFPGDAKFTPVEDHPLGANVAYGEVPRLDWAHPPAALVSHGRGSCRGGGE